MLRHKWEAATATILNVQSEPGPTPVHHYQVEVRKQNGEVTTSRVSEQSQVVRAVGEKLNVEMHSQSGELRMHGSRAEALRGVVNMAQMMRDVGASGGAGGLAAGVAGMLAGQQGTRPVNVMGPGGQFVPMNLDPNEMRNLTRALVAGSPAEKQAARQRLQEIKTQAQQQAGNQQGGFGQQQGGFGQQQQQGGFGPQQQQGGFGPQQQQGGFAGQAQTGFGGQQQATGGFSGSGPTSFDDIGTPRHPASPGPGALNQQGGFGPAQSAFGSFNMGGGQGSREERLANLQQQLNKGILTESEYEVQRQQIINGG